MYKRCPVCGSSWRSPASFADDAELLLIGVQGMLQPDRLQAVFVHACGTTLTAPILDFAGRGLLADDAPKAPRWRVASTIGRSAGRALSEALFMTVAEPNPSEVSGRIVAYH